MAEDLDGAEYISLNFYCAGTVDRLKPCEMPAKKVRSFIMALVPDT